MRVALRTVFPIIDLIAGIAVALVLWRARGLKSDYAAFFVVLLSLIAAWLALVDFSGRIWPAPAETISPHPDAWSYNAFADYLTNNSRGRMAGMSLVDEYAVHLSNTRFAAPSLLACLEGIPGLGDPPVAHWTFMLVCFGTHFFSFLYLARSLVFEWFWAVVTAFTATAGGWLGDAAYCGNYDNLLFVALATALIGILVRIKMHGVNGGRRFFWPGTLISAALIYCYPEGLVILLVLVSPLLIALLSDALRSRAKSQLLLLGAIAGGALIIASPYLPVLVPFLRSQMSMGLQNGSVRPGSGVMPGLLNERFLPSFFALGEEINPSFSWLNDLLPILLLCLVIIGTISIGRRFALFPWCGLVLIGLIVWQDLFARYDYGTFKVLFCASWWVYAAAIGGLAVVGNKIKEGKLARLGLAGGLLVAIGSEKFEDRQARSVLPPLSIQPLRELQSMRKVIGTSPILLNVDGEFDYLWSVYYLRRLAINVETRRSYLGMPHIGAWLDRAAAPRIEDCKYVLISGGAARDSVWHNARFSLVREDQPRVVGLENPNGVELVNGERFIWLGTQAAILHVVVTETGAYELRATQFGAGPSGPDIPDRALRVTDAEGSHVVTVGAESKGIPLQLRAGDNEVKLQCLDAPRKNAPTSGDPRDLILALRGFYVVKASGIRSSANDRSLPTVAGSGRSFLPSGTASLAAADAVRRLVSPLEAP